MLFRSCTDMLPTPKFHHLHLNSTDPGAAINFYTTQFPSTSRGSWGGFPALKSPNDVMVLFTKVDTPPVSEPQSAIWHFGWHVTDSRRSLENYKSRREVELLPLYTSEEGGSVPISSDTWPGQGGVLGLTKAQIAEARQKGLGPAGGGGFAYMKGPDDALVEYAGDHPAERFNHVHLYQEDPLSAQLWYQKHLNAPPRAGWGGAGDRGRLQGATRRRPHLAGAQSRRDVPVAAGRRRIRRCGADLVRQPARQAACRLARPIAGSHRVERRRSRCLDR